LQLQANYLPAAYSLATLDLAEKRPEDARNRFEAMIAKDDKNDQLYLALAELQARTGADSKAVGETLQRAVRANPQSAPARLALISFQLRNKDVKAALSSAQGAMMAMPSDPRVLDAVGMAQEAAGEVNQAIETYNKLASLQPQSVQPLMRLTALHVRLKETDKAIDALRRVQKISPQDGRVVPQLVQVYLAGNRPEDALREVREFQKRQPKLAIGYALEGEIRMVQRKLPEAEQAFRESLRLQPSGDAVAVRLLDVLHARGKTADADIFVKKWTTDNPRDINVRLYLGDRALNERNLKVAAGHFQGVVAIDPRNVVALNNLAWIGGELGDSKAMEYAERALKIDANNPAVLDTYGVLLLGKGDVQAALPVLERAKQSAPDRNDIRLHLAKALIKAGRKEDARRELEVLAKVTENFAGKAEVSGLLKGL
jgi:putative PEP-CTERM system TPR-repeat lipoprotein